jgi:hypothetical protein
MHMVVLQVGEMGFGWHAAPLIAAQPRPLPATCRMPLLPMLLVQHLRQC